VGGTLILIYKLRVRRERYFDLGYKNYTRINAFTVSNLYLHVATNRTHGILNEPSVMCMYVCRLYLYLHVATNRTWYFE